MSSHVDPKLGITAILITRESEWPRDALLNFPFDEVIVETKCVGVHRRFELALQARNEIVYVQDDDCLIDVAKLFTFYDGVMTYAITPGHKHIYDELCGSRTCLIGWGCFFPRVLADPDRWKPYVDAYGPVPSIEADRVFTWYAGPRLPVVMPIRSLRRERAMSRDNGDHYTSRDRILRQLKELDVCVCVDMPPGGLWPAVQAPSDACPVHRGGTR